MNKELWSKAQGVLQKELAPQVFERWIRPLKPLDETEGGFSLAVPDEFFRNWLLDHYHGMIQSALREASGDRDFEAVYTIRAEEKSTDSPVPRPPVPSAQAAAAESVLNSKYTFESFVVGPSNRFAQAASMAVAQSPAKAYNPLFIYGPVGLGKTHLMQAIGQDILSRSAGVKVLYITSEKFTNQLINAIKTGTTMRFRATYRNVDVLLIDDVHFIAGKEATMEEFFHTFNALYDAHKQIVVSSDKPPSAINNLEERLVSRFQWGIVADIQPPDFETRTAILRKKAEREELNVPESVTFFIADKIKSNIRELEGALIRVVAYAKLVGKEVNEAVAAEVLKDLILETEKKITIDLIQRRVAEYFEVRLSDMTAKRRSRNVVYPRHVAMYLSREMTSLSFPEIGEQFGGRDHTTVLHAYEKIKRDVKKDLKSKSLVDKLVVEIKK